MNNNCVDLDVCGGNIPDDMLLPVSYPESMPQDPLSQQIVHLHAIHPNLVQFRTGTCRGGLDDLDSMDAHTKRMLLADMRNALRIKPLR